MPAFEAGLEQPAGEGNERWVDWTPFTYPFNLTQQPAASVPCGVTEAGLPAGLQIVGARYADALVLRAAAAFEAAAPFAMPDLDEEAPTAPGLDLVPRPAFRSAVRPQPIINDEWHRTSVQGRPGAASRRMRVWRGRRLPGWRTPFA